LPFLVLEDKLLAWLISNGLGVVWISWYGVQLGKASGKSRWFLGAIMGTVGILFLIVSYLVWT